MSVLLPIFIALGVGTLGTALVCRRSSRLSMEARGLFPMLGGALALGIYALFVIATQ